MFRSFLVKLIAQLQFKHFFFIFIHLFLAVLGLCCCMWAFSSCRDQGLFSSCGVQTSYCGGFSCGAWALGHAVFSSCCTWAQ